MSFVEAEVDYAENDWVKESLADDEDDNSLYHYKNKKIIVKTDIFFHLCPCSCKPKPVQIILQHLSYLSVSFPAVCFSHQYHQINLLVNEYEVW